MASEKFADFVVNSKIDRSTFPSLPQTMIDTLSCAIAGTKGPFADEVRETYTLFSAVPQASVFLAQGKTSVRDAAAINAYLARNYTFDDVFEPGTIHAASAVIMTGLALGEWLDADMDQLVASIAVGYEVAARISAAINPQHYDKGFHPTGTCNTIGAAATAARLMGLNQHHTCSALRLAADAACGFRQYQLDGSIVNSAYHAAKAAENGIVSAFLAQRGFADPGESITGDFGLLRCEAGSWDDDVLLGGLGREYRFLQSSLKPYPSCRFMHGAVDAVAKCMSANNIKADDIEAVTISTFALAADEGDRPQPKNVLDAQFSIHYNIAAYLHKKGMGIEDFTMEAIADPKIADFEKRISVEKDAQMTAQYPALWPYRANIVTKEGGSFSYLVEQPIGSPANPLSDEVFRNKCYLLLLPVIGEAKACRFLDKAGDFPAFSTVRQYVSFVHDPV